MGRNRMGGGITLGLRVGWPLTPYNILVMTPSLDIPDRDLRLVDHRPLKLL